MAETEYLSESSVAKFFDTSTTTVRRWVRDGVLPAPRVLGGSKRWFIADLRAAAARALDGASSRSAPSTDPDAIIANMVPYVPAKDRKAHAR